jgi:hypothetical protein
MLISAKDYHTQLVARAAEAQAEIQRLTRELEATRVSLHRGGPYWDVLREELAKGLDPETVISIGSEGEQIRLRDLAESIAGDGVLAMKFVRAATLAFALSLVEIPEPGVKG